MSLLPRLSELISAGDLPSELGTLLDAENMLSNSLYFQDYFSSRNASGSSGVYELTIVTNDPFKLEFPAASGFALVGNPGAQSASETSIELSYRWELLAFVKGITSSNFGSTNRDYFDLFYKMTGVSPRDILNETLITVIGGTNPYSTFVSDFNTNYSPNTTLNLTTISQQEDPIESLVLRVQEEGEDIFDVIFNDYIDVNSNTVQNIKDLFERWFGTFDFNDILTDVLIPQLEASIDNLTLALEFPRDINGVPFLIPLDSGGAQINDPNDPNYQAKLTFDVGQLNFSTQDGFSFDAANNLSFTSSSLGGTGLVLSFSGGSIDISKTSSIQEALDDGRTEEFVGVYIGTAALTLPQAWTNTGSGAIGATDLLIGSEGGISGDFTLSGGDLEFTAFGCEFSFDQNDFQLTFDQNVITSAGFSGTITFPFIHDGTSPAAIDIDIEWDATEEKFHATLDSASGLKFGNFDVTNLDIEFWFVGGTLHNFSLSFDLSSSALSANIGVSVAYTNDEFQFALSNNVPLEVFGLSLTITSFSAVLDGNLELQSADMEATLAINEIKNSTGTNTQQIYVDMNYEVVNQVWTYELSLASGQTSTLASLKLFDLEFGIQSFSGQDFSIKFSDSSLDEFYLPFFIKVDKIEDGGNTASIAGLMEYGEVGTVWTYSVDFHFGTPLSLTLFDVEFQLTDFEVTFSQAGFIDFDVTGNLLIDHIKDSTETGPQPIGITLGYNYGQTDNFYALVNNLPILTLGGIQLHGPVNGAAGATIEVEFTNDGTLETFKLLGTIRHDAAADQSGTQLSTIGFDVDYDGSDFTFVIDADLNNPVTVYFKSVQINLTSLGVTWDVDNQTLNAITGGGELILDGVQGDPIEIDASITNKDEFFVHVNNTNPGFGLEIPNIVNFTLREFTLGREKPSSTAYWFVHFGDPGNTNQSQDDNIALDADVTLSIPVIDKFIPERIGINNLKLKVDGGVSVDQPMFFVTWEALDGIDVSGSPTGFDITVPLNLSIMNVVNVSSARLKYDSTQDEVKMLASGSVVLGPLVGSVKDIGVKMKLEQSTGSGGNLGPINIGDYALSPPTGMGLSLDAVVFKGGGYLQYEDGEYAGVLQVSIVDVVTVTAVGIISTKNLPGNIKFSLIIVISAEFQPIQLGFGFTLNGAGGLFGLHRTMNVDFLAAGVKSGAIESILFPDNPIENAPKIISDISQAFPIKPDQFVFGPMAIIGWGTPSLITVDFGLIVEIPNPFTIAILGVVRTILPDEELAIVKIQVNFIGVLSFNDKFMWLRASLFESTLNGMTLSGDMAFVMSWGSDPVFVITAGGFHPKFDPPEGYTALQNLDRMSVTVIDIKENSLTLKLIIEAYFAVTSNTVQFGALVDFYAKVSVGEGKADLKFNALFVFSPFSFETDLSAEISISAAGVDLIKADLDLAFTGPRPYHADGTADFKVAGVKKKFEVTKTWGETDDTTYEEINVWNLIVADLQKLGNWISEINPVAGRQVTIRKVADVEEEVVLDPEGDIVIRQKVVPLGISIKKLGNRYATEVKSYTLSAEVAGDTNPYTTSVKDYFATSNYKEVSSDDRLAGASYEQYNNGIRVKPGGQANREYSDFAVYRQIKYETSMQDINESQYLGIQMPPELASANEGYAYVGGGGSPDDQFTAGLLGNTVANSPVSRSRSIGSPGFFASQRVSVSPKGFVVANQSDLSAYDSNSVAGTMAEAEEYMQSLISQNPALEEQLLVMDELSYNN